MLVAALDTSTLTLSCALVDLGEGGARVLAETAEAPAKPAEERGSAPRRAERGSADHPKAKGPAGGHGVRLPALLLELLAGAGRGVRDVEAYAIGLGPGSFTGLRIGLATLKGLAYASRRTLAGASSLAALALEAAEKAPADALLVPLLDARKGELYAGFYRREGGSVARVKPEAALPPEALARELAAEPGALLFGEGLAAYRGAFASLRALDGPLAPSAACVARLAAADLAKPYDAQRLFALEPHYVRPSEAEVKFPHGMPPSR